MGANREESGGEEATGDGRRDKEAVEKGIYLGEFGDGNNFGLSGMARVLRRRVEQGGGNCQVEAGGKRVRSATTGLV